MQTIVSATYMLEVATLDISLRDLMGSAHGWGHVQGALVADRVRSRVEACPASIIRLSLRGVEQMDVSFAGELIRLISHERLRRGFCLVGVSDRDLVANWDAAAQRHVQPLFAWDEEMKGCFLGPEPSAGLREMLRYVLSVPVTRTSEVATALHLKTQNASNKLKQLWTEGYILRREQSAGSGGIEYEYLRIV